MKTRFKEAPAVFFHLVTDECVMVKYIINTSVTHHLRKPHTHAHTCGRTYQTLCSHQQAVQHVGLMLRRASCVNHPASSSSSSSSSSSWWHTGHMSVSGTEPWLSAGEKTGSQFGGKAFLSSFSFTSIRKIKPAAGLICHQRRLSQLVRGPERRKCEDGQWQHHCQGGEELLDSLGESLLSII